jgi:hypothetical protein
MVNLEFYGLKLALDIHHAISEPSTRHANGYSELEWTLSSGEDEIGETISKESLDLISIQFQSDIERAIWAQIGR